MATREKQRKCSSRPRPSYKIGLSLATLAYRFTGSPLSWSLHFYHSILPTPKVLWVSYSWHGRICMGFGGLGSRDGLQALFLGVEFQLQLTSPKPLPFLCYLTYKPFLCSILPSPFILFNLIRSSKALHWSFSFYSLF